MVGNFSFHITRGLRQNEPYIDTACSTLGCRFITRWANGEVGAIVKLNYNNVLYFVDYMYNPGHGDIFDDIRQIHKIGEEEKACPIVASGIIAYWLIERQDDKSISQIFEEYYKMEENKYIEENKKSLDAWKRDLKLEFCKKHLEQEQNMIKMSEKIFPYLDSKSIDLIKSLAENYLEYIQSQDDKKKNENSDPITEEKIIIAESLYDEQAEELHLPPLKTNNKSAKSVGGKNGRPKAKPFEDYVKKDAPKVCMEVLEKMLEGKKGKKAALIIKACTGYWIDVPENKSVVDRFPSVKPTSFNNAMGNPSLFSIE